MISSLVAALALAPVAHAPVEEACFLEPTGRAAEIVEAAWQESAKQKKERERLDADVKADIEIGKKYAAEAEKEFKVSDNKEYQDRVARIGGELAAIANAAPVSVSWGDPRHAKFDYTFKVIKSKEGNNTVNAFSLPGGFIFVFEGLVKFAESDDELAGVLAHEISHASFRHMATLEKEASKLQMISLPAILVALLSGGKAGGDVLIASQLINQSSASGWGQKAELSADYGSLQYLVKSKYNPVGMLTFIERLARSQRAIESIDWGIYRTHPPSRERAEAITKYLEANKIPIRRSLVSTSSRVQLEPQPDGSVEASFGGKTIFTFAGPIAAQRAETASAKLNEFFDSVPQLYEVSFSPDGVIRGRKDTLFRITQEDAQAAKVPVERLSAETVKAIKGSMFVLAFRVWDAR